MKLFFLVLIKMCFVFYQSVGQGVRWTCPLFCPQQFFKRGKSVGAKRQSLLDHYLNAKTAGEEKAAESWSLKFLPPCWLHLPKQLSFPSQDRSRGTVRECSLAKESRQTFRLDMAGMSWTTAQAHKMEKSTHKCYSSALPMPYLMFNTKPRQKQPGPHKCISVSFLVFPFTKEEATSQERSYSAKYLHPAWKFSPFIIL